MALQVGYKVQLEELGEIIVSDPDQEVFEFVWRLKKFAAAFQDHYITSPTFTSATTKTEWRAIVLMESINLAIMYVGLQLVKSGNDTLPVPTAYNFCFLNSEMEVRKGPFGGEIIFKRNGDSDKLYIDYCGSFHSPRNGYLAADGSLNLLFRVTTTQYNPNSVKLEEPQPVISSTMNKETFKSLLENGEFSDLIVKTKTNSFPASKMILAVQSPVFKAMFLTDMLETKENVVKIEDFSDETVKMFLEFLYTGQCESLEENAVELLKIGDKYEVVDLKRTCEKSLINALNKENAADLLILASFYNSTLLKSKVVSFVKRCRKEVAETKSFKELKKLHPGILLDLYAEFD